MAHSPTTEQTQIIDAFKTGDNLVIEAGAGTGKTSTLRMMAEAVMEKSFTNKRGIYIAYNKAIAEDAKASFPGTVNARTAHSFAYQAVGKDYRSRLNGPRVPARQAAQILGIYQPFQVNETVLMPTTIASLVDRTVSNFANSADDEVQAYHVPKVDGAESVMDDLRTMIVPFARKAWADLTSKSGKLKFKHDHYLKIWAMSEPTLRADFILLDEAQDANPVIAQVVEAQDHAQKIMVGDRSQAIYGWRGAVDAMTRFDPSAQRLLLSQSFRFGSAVADEANKWLSLLDAPLRLSGFDQIDSKIEHLDAPDAVLARTNAEVMARAIGAMNEGRRAAIVGGTREIKSLAEAALDLQSGRSTWHPDLIAFSSWDELRTYAQDEAGRDLRVFVKLIDTYGAHKVIEVADASVNEGDADVILSTAHKAKGREWDKVQIAADFGQSDDSKDSGPSRPEMMLNYVAVTRAKLVLDNAALSWVDQVVNV